MEKNGGSSSAQLEELSKHFNILYVLILAFAFLLAGRMFFPSRTTMNDAGAFVAGALAGMAVSAAVMKRGRTAKLAALGGCLLLFAALYGAGRYWISDAHQAKAAWPAHVMGSSQFSYPGSFKPYDMKGSVLANGSVDVYSNENYKRLVCYYIYDFGVGPVDGDALLSNNVASMLNSLHATDPAVSKTEKDGNLTRIQYTYTIKGQKLTGCAGIYLDGVHAELVTFYPVSKAVSAAFLNRVYDGIQTAQR